MHSSMKFMLLSVFLDYSCSNSTCNLPQKYVIETNHIGHIITFFMNKDVYHSLPENVRQLVDECAAAATAYGNAKADASIKQYKQICIDAGDQIITLDPSVVEEIRQKGKVVQQMVRRDVGNNIVDQLMDAIEQTKKQ